MITIAVTGGIACGKSTVAGLMAADGLPVCDADELAHAVLEPGMAAHVGVVGHFGDGILDADGRIDRRKLGRIVFADGEQRAVLNRLVHPWVAEGWRQWIGGLGDGCRRAAVVVPLLYEAGFAGGWSAVVCVSALRETQLARLALRGLGEQEAVQRIGAQMPMREKELRSDYVIMNEGSKDLLRRQTQSVLRSITERQTW
jgi:dephospho-CoA kinase